MRLRGETTPTFVGLLTLVLLYLVLVTLILIFSRQIVSDISSVGSATGLATTLIALVLPIALVAAIVINLVKLIRDRTRHRAGARLKTRLLLFFAFIALLALIPQAVLSTTFINSAINFWVSAGVGEALEGGLSVSLAYHTDKVRNLRAFSQSPLLTTLLEPLREDPDLAYQNLTSANPEIGLLQVFDADGNELYHRGEAAGRLTDIAALQRTPAGSPVKRTREDVTILRVVVAPEGARTEIVVLGIVYPRRFDELASSITTSRRIYKQLFQYQSVFRGVVIAFYIFFSFPILLLAILVSFLLTEDIIRPIVHLEEATRRVADGDFSFRLLSRRGDELTALVDSFNRMIAELDTSRRKLVQAEKITAWKEIAQRLAHEIRNPLTPIKLSAQRILRKAAAKEQLDEVLEPAVTAIIREVDNLNRLLVEFREFTRLPDPHPETVSARRLVDEVLSVYENLSNRVEVDCHYHAEQDSITVDRVQIKQVLANLIKNAVQAMPDGGKLTILTDLVSKDGNEYFRFQVQDTGRGMDAETRSKAFEPYFTTKRDGSGLGLAIVERIIFDHDGAIWFETSEGGGTTFFIDLPRGSA